MARLVRLLGTTALAALVCSGVVTTARELRNTAEVLRPSPSINVFRRFDIEAAKIFQFYGEVLGLRALGTFTDVGAGGVSRFRAGAQELKFTQRVGDRQYADGGVKDATGLRLVTFFFPNEQELAARFEKLGYAKPQFSQRGDRRVALVDDPDGQQVELVIEPNQPEAAYNRIEVGLTVADLERSRDFYRSFVGLEELAPRDDAVFGTKAYGFRHGSVTINLRHFGGRLPRDTGSGGIQYVVSDVESVNELALKRGVTVETPLSTLAGYALRTVWLNDPDGITNYFAQTGGAPGAGGAGGARRGGGPGAGAGTGAPAPASR